MMMHETETRKKIRALEPIFFSYLDHSSKDGPYWHETIKEDSPQEVKKAFAEWCRLKAIHERERDEFCDGFAH